MDHDNIFRYVLIFGFVAVLPFGMYHRMKAAASGEKLDRRQEGVFILATLRPIAFARLAAVFAFVIDPAWMRWSQVDLPLGVRWAGVGFGVFGAVLLVVVFRTLGTNITDTVVTRKCHELVTNGPYRWVRHPFYVAAALAMTADSLVTANWFLALTGALVFGLMVIRTKTEEQKLIERFGDAYTDYMARTGRFVPRKRG